MTTSTESRGLPFIVATFFGVGLSPVAPGTIGSIVALPLAVLLLHWPILFSGVTLLALFVLGTWCANHLERCTGLHDAQIIVIDEVVGQCLTLLILGTWFLTHIDPYVLLALSFVSFRLIDIVKPWPVSWLDQQIGGGLGVMVDDVAAALIAAGLVAGSYSLMQLAWS
jgi:phosphatidylglycerophosphatase A